MDDIRYDQLDLEKRFLSCCMNTDDFQDRMEGLDKASLYFTDIDNREIFKHLLKVAKTGYHFDPFAFHSELNRETVSQIDISMLHSLGQVSFQLKTYLEALRSGYMRQKAISMLDYAKNNMIGSKSDIKAILTELIKHTETILDSGEEEKIRTGEECYDEAVEDIMGKLFRPGGVVGYASGMNFLDRITRGWEKTKLYVVAGRPGAGKSTLAINIVTGLLDTEHLNPFIVSMEMVGGELMTRVVQNKLNIDLYSEDKNEKTQYSVDLIDQKCIITPIVRRLHIAEGSTYTKTKLFTMARKRHRQGKCDVLVIDHIGLCSEENNEDRRQMLGAISRGSKALAKELNIPVIILSQLNRLSEQAGNRRPILSDLRECGDIEQDVNCAIFIHDTNKEDKENEDYELIIPKNRGGKCDNVPTRFNKAFQRFEFRMALNKD